MGSRTQELKANVVLKTHKVAARGLQREEEGKAFRPGVRLCLERARLLTESYRRTEGQPMVIRRAEALAHILRNMTIYIEPDELLVGNFASGPEAVAHYPELQWRWVEKAVNDGYRDILDSMGKEELRKLHEYWQTRSVHGKERELLPEDIQPYWQYKGVALWMYQWEMGTPNYEKVFQVGFEGLIREAEGKLREIKDAFTRMSMGSKEYLEKKGFLQAVLVTLRAAIEWAERYAELARSLAEAEPRAERKEELERIAEICSHVSRHPPRSLQEALQCFLLIHLVVDYIEIPQVGCGVRFDQIFDPFYERDLMEGKLTREGAQELLECLWVKFLETGFLHPPVWTGSGGGGLGWQTITIGGVDGEGKDATNETTYLVLDSIKSLYSLQPPLALRWHQGTPPELLLKTTEVLSTGLSQPALFNDEVNISRLVALGVPLEDARDYSINNCMYPMIPGKNIVPRTAAAGVVFLPKCLELALNRGRDMRIGEQLSCETPDPEAFTSVEEIMDALTEHYKFHAQKSFHISNIASALYEEYVPRPFLSALLDECIQRAEDCRKWSYLPLDSIQVVGITNVADSLAAIKKLVFEERRVSMAELLDILKTNWEGKEEVRQMFLNEAPKFGNDDDYVDLIAREINYRLSEETKRFKSYHGAPWLLDGSVASSPYSYAIDTWATPDGRKAGMAFNDGTISPVGGRDKRGPTAVLKSASKIEVLRSHNHLLNQTFFPQYLKGSHAELFANYLRTWGDLGIHHIQFTVTDPQAMRDAQKHPERHANLVVRVCGYSAYFVDLSRGLQDAIIERTAQELGEPVRTGAGTV